MTFNKALIIIIFGILVISCGSNSDLKNPNFSILTNQKANLFKLNDSIKIDLKNKKKKEVKSVTYKLDDKIIEPNSVLNNVKLGSHQLWATIETEDGEQVNISTEIIINNNLKPQIFGFKIINEFPHDITSYTQGLEFYKDTLYESTGQYGESKLRKLNYETGEVLKNVDLDKKYFGEGLTILGESLYQLTWQSNTGFVYDVNTFEKKRTFSYGVSKEGWGLCNDGKKLYKSDGTEAIYELNPESLSEGNKIEVYTNNGKIASLNELEWVDGKIFANIYQRNGVAIIDPANGAVEGVIDFSSLKKKVTQHPGLDVLNGVAYNSKRKTLFVTGKRWDKLFEVEIFQK